MMPVTIVAHGSRYAVIERRGRLLYNCHDQSREAIPADQLSNAGRIFDYSDWTDRETALAIFEQIVACGTQLAQRMF